MVSTARCQDFSEANWKMCYKHISPVTYCKSHTANSAFLFIYFGVLNAGAMTTMASIDMKGARRYSRGAAIAIGMIVLLVLTTVLIAAAPGKHMLGAFGVADSNPMSGIMDVSSWSDMKCALQVMSCNLAP